MNTPVTTKLKAELYQTLNNASESPIKPDLISTPLNLFL